MPTVPLEIEQTNVSSTGAAEVPASAEPAADGANGKVEGTATEAPNASLNTLAGQHADATDIALYRPLRPVALTFQRLESREGVVLEVDTDEGYFRARLVDPRADEPDQEVEVDLEQVSPVDFGLVKPGALFFWAIGYVTRPSGRRNLQLTVDFRRLSQARQDVVARAEAGAEAYLEDMNWS